MERTPGKTLRDAREARGLTIDDAVYRARLPRDVVEALESGDFGFFTSPLYARSFLRQYADYVGADVSEWIDDLVPTPMVGAASVGTFINLAEAKAPPTREREKTRPPSGGAMAAAWLIIITGGLVWGGLAYFRDLENKFSNAPLAPAPKAPEKAIAPTPPPAGGNPDVATGEPEAPRRAIIVQVPGE